MRHLTNCFGGAGAYSGGTARTDRSVCGKPLRRWTRRYSSQRDEFYHAKQILSLREREQPPTREEALARFSPALVV